MNHLGKPSFVSFNGVDITADVQTVTMATELATESFWRSEPIRLAMRNAITPHGYKVLLGRTHPRISRMHTAYGRRRRSW